MGSRTGCFCGVSPDLLLAAIYAPQSQQHLLRQPDLINDLPFLRITDACRVKPVGELVLRPCRVMPDQCCCEVLRNPCALTLRDEPLAGAVEHGASELWVTSAQVCIPLHNPVHTEVGEQPARRWQSRIQQPLKHPMQWHLPLSCLGLQQVSPCSA